MPQSDIFITDDNIVQMTDVEQKYLQSFLDAGDRGGFYLAYHNMTGSAQALEQAKISSFSEELGGAAFAANTLLQEYYGPQNKYAGIYFISQNVALEAFNKINENIDDKGSGVITDKEMFKSAQKAWEVGWPVHNQLYQFPGNGLSVLNWVTEVVDPLLSSSYHPTFLLLDKVAEGLNKVTDIYGLDPSVDAYEFFIKELGISGALATFAASFGSILFGKRLSDYEGHAGYTTHVLPDSTFKVVTKSNGMVVGIFDNTFFPDFSFEILEILASFPGAIAAVVANNIPFISDTLSWYRRQLSESSPGINGDRNPIETNTYLDSKPSFPISTTPNSSSGSTLWGASNLILNDDDTIEGSSGKDSIFGGEGDDTLSGGGENDLLYGDEDDDHLYGNAGEDILRGGAGDDTLDGGAEDDILDGGDLKTSVGTGNDILYGGGGNDQLYGGDGADTLTGGKGQDILNGGAGNDTYIYNPGDQQMIIQDSDGSGSILIKAKSGDFILGGMIKQWSTDAPVYRDDKGNIYTVGGNDLFITTSDGGKIIVEDFTTGKLGIILPTDPVQLPDTNNTIVGDLAYQDFDPDTDGIQIQTDDLGNKITLEGNEKEQTDRLFGSENADLIQSGALNDHIESKGGGDIIQSGNGNDKVWGGSGKDFIYGGSDTDILIGGAGDDTIYADKTADLVEAFISDDTAVSNTRDWLAGGDGDDQLIGSSGVDFLSGGGGHDLLVSGAGNDFIEGDHDWVTSSFNWTGTLADGYITFGPVTRVFDPSAPGVDTIYAGSGDDHVWAGGDNDNVFGGSGNDQLSGESGDDILYGGEDNDRLQGDSPNLETEYHGNDELYGGNGNDKLWGNAGNDLLSGDGGNDKLYGGEGDDDYYFTLGDGIDVISDTEDKNQVFLATDLSTISVGLVNSTDGSSYLAVQYGNNDIVYIQDAVQGSVQSYTVGGTTYQYGELIEVAMTEAMDYQITEDGGTLYAGGFNDTLKGSNADDQIYGQGGDDILAGAGGDDLLVGGEGQDTYILGIGSGSDTIIETGDEINTIRLHEGLSLTDLATEKRGQDLFIHLYNSRDGMMLKDYYNGQPEWKIQTADGRISALSGLTQPGSSLIAASVTEIKENYIKQVEAFYHGLLKVDGFQREADGLSHKTQLYSGTKYHTTRHYQRGVEIDAQVINGDVAASYRSYVFLNGRYSYQGIQEKNLIETSTLINSFTQTETQTQLNTQHASFVQAGASNGSYIDFSVHAGTSSAESDLLIPDYGSVVYTDPLTGNVNPGITGFWVYPNEASVQYTEITSTVAHKEYEYNQSLLIRDLISGGNTNNLQLWDYYFNRVDAGTGDDILNLEPDYQHFTGSGLLLNDLTLEIEDRNKVDMTRAPGSLLYGNSGNDQIRGSLRGDIIIGGEGGDTLYGGKGNDVYYQFHGDGHDVIFDEGTAGENDDIIVLPEGVRVADISVNWNETLMAARLQDSTWLGRVESLHRVLTLTWGTTDQIDIVLPHADSSTGYGIDHLVFDDGSRLSLTDLVGLKNIGPVPTFNPHLSNNVLSSEGVLYGSDGDDILKQLASSSESRDSESSEPQPSDIFDIPRLIGGNGHDQLIGSESDDQLYGGSVILYDAVDYYDSTAFFALGGLWYAGNTYHGGLGDDTLWTTAGSDTIEFNLNDGIDTVTDLLHHQLYSVYAVDREYGGLGSQALNDRLTDWQDPAALEDGHLEQLTSNQDTLRFGEGIEANDIFISRGPRYEGRGDDLLLSHKNGSDRVSFSNWYTAEINQLNRVEFADGTVWEGDYLRNSIEERANSTNLVTPIPDQTVIEDVRYALSMNLGQFFTSPEDLTFDITLGGSPLPDWISFSQKYGWFSVKNPTNNAVGNHTIEVTATNTSGLSIRDEFNLTVINSNDAPVINNVIEDQTAMQGEYFSFTLPKDSFIDIDKGDGLNYSITLSDGQPLPKWLTFNPDNLSMSGTPGQNDTNISGIQVSVTDQENATVSSSFNLNIDAGTLLGTQGEDRLVGTAGNETIIGAGRNDKLYGREGNDTLQGGTGNDLLDGGTGADTLIGGHGSDRYIVDNPGDTVTELADEGHDHVYSYIDHTLNDHLENLYLIGNDPLTGVGNNQNNTLFGNSGANTLSGADGNDSLYGSDGDDTLLGGAGNDFLFGGNGVDNLSGGTGDDIYVVKSTDDAVSESMDEGYDRVYSYIDYSLGSNLEQLSLRGSSDLTGIGNNEDNKLYGNKGANVLNGAEGNDLLFGKDGDDTLQGGAGKDSLQGGSGDDTLNGGSGDDTYLFARGDDQDTIVENDTSINNHDVLSFIHDINHDQLWFSQQDNDLRINVIGTDDQVTIADWYDGPTRQLEEINTSDGHILANNQIDQLVSAMASFNVPPAGEFTLSDEVNEQIAPVLAVSWT